MLCQPYVCLRLGESCHSDKGDLILSDLFINYAFHPFARATRREKLSSGRENPNIVQENFRNTSQRCESRCLSKQ
ncbi:hypothetical protein PUN28_009965 [Cardiocondyla obscurior]|uniref:Uncharacterized protein n=1 Tax=Cardiocondyla obscurior TaxID=286306 RepID=A0AAW2FPR9_9HYME